MLKSPETAIELVKSLLKEHTTYVTQEMEIKYLP